MNADGSIRDGRPRVRVAADGKCLDESVLRPANYRESRMGGQAERRLSAGRQRGTGRHDGGVASQGPSGILASARTFEWKTAASSSTIVNNEEWVPMGEVPRCVGGCAHPSALSSGLLLS